MLIGGRAFDGELYALLRQVSFIAPNLCNDEHDCGLSTGDGWLQAHVAAMLANGATVILTYDEGSTSAGINGTSGGGNIYTVVVGPHASLACRQVDAKGRLYVPVRRVAAKLRYRSPAIPALVEERPHGFALELDEPAFGVAAGQAAVLYDGEAVVGAGLIRT